MSLSAPFCLARTAFTAYHTAVCIICFSYLLFEVFCKVISHESSGVMLYILKQFRMFVFILLTHAPSILRHREGVEMSLVTGIVDITY